jgi:hypothetical protein
MATEIVSTKLVATVVMSVVVVVVAVAVEEEVVTSEEVTVLAKAIEAVKSLTPIVNFWMGPPVGAPKKGSSTKLDSSTTYVTLGNWQGGCGGMCTTSRTMVVDDLPQVFLASIV